jgi:hypothetical protein
VSLQGHGLILGRGITAKKEDGVDTVIVVIGPVNRHPTSATQTHDFYLYKVKTMA